MVLAGMKTADAILEYGLTPDVKFDRDLSDKVFYLHRRTSEADIYYLTNQSGEDYTLRASFRSEGHAEIWHPEYGTVTDADLSALKIGPEEALFVVFRNGSTPSGRHLPGSGTVKESLPVGKTWKVSFFAPRQSNAQIKMSELVSWSESDDTGIRYYSGTAEYSTMLNLSTDILKKGEAFVLDLGDVRDIARVYVNGRDAGTCWHHPFRLDITPWLKAGGNSLRIAVANTWINRVIGDEQYPADIPYSEDGAKFTTGKLTAYPSWLYEPQMPAERKRVTFYSWKHYDKNSDLVPSGLLGPVKLHIINNK